MICVPTFSLGSRPTTTNFIDQQIMSNTWGSKKRSSMGSITQWEKIILLEILVLRVQRSTLQHPNLHIIKMPHATCGREITPPPTLASQIILNHLKNAWDIPKCWEHTFSMSCDCSPSNSKCERSHTSSISVHGQYYFYVEQSFLADLSGAIGF